MSQSNKVAKKVKGFLKRDKVMLNVGCGTDYKEGWVNIDNNSDDNIEKVDLDWDLRNPIPFPDGSVDFIFNEHFQEHLTVEEGIGVNKDFLRTLKPGGILRIATPDLEQVADSYLHSSLDKDPVIKQFNIDFVKTRAEWINMAFSWWGHKYLYDYEELERRLKEAGFTNVKRVKIGDSEYAELRNVEIRPEASLVVEATK